MKNVISFFIYTNLYVSICVVSLYKITEILFGFSNNMISFLVFFTTLFAYNYMRMPLFSIQSISSRSFWIQKNSNVIYTILTISFFASLYYISLLGIIYLYLITPVIIISFLYPLRLKIKCNYLSIREFPLLKIFLVAFSWSFITILAPLLYLNYVIDYNVIVHFFRIILFIVAISIPFDIRDFSIDQISTIPRLIGILNSKIFALFCLFIFEMSLIVDLLKNIISVTDFFAFFLTIELSALVIYFSNEKKSEWFFSVVVESLSIIMFLFVLILSLI